MASPGGVILKRAGCAMVVACVIGAGTARAGYLQAWGSVAPNVGQDLLPAPQGVYPQAYLNGALSSDVTSLPTQTFSWDGTSYIESDHVGHTSSTISSWARMGSLGAYAQTTASVENGGYVQGRAEVTTRFSDTFTVHGPAAPDGRVTLNLRLYVHGVSDTTTVGPVDYESDYPTIGTFSASLSIEDLYAQGYPADLHANSYQGESVYVDQPISLYADGRQYRITGELGVTAVATAALTSWAHRTGASAEMDALNTSQSFIWSDNPDVYIEAASGASYNVPEPTSLALLILAPAGLLRRRRPESASCVC